MKYAIILALPLLLLTGCAGPRAKKAPAAPVEERSAEREAAVRPTAPRPLPPRSAAPSPAQQLLPAPAPRTLHAPSAPPPVRGAPSPTGSEKYVSLNFDNADIGVVIQTIAELIGLNYIVAPGVQGRVTIQSTSKLPVSTLFTVLEEILEVNALSAVKSGDFYKIVPTNQARQKVIETVVEGETGPVGNPIITKVVPLTFIRPSEVVKILNPLKSQAGLYLAHDPTRLLFLSDSSKKIDEMMKIVAILDIDTFAQIQVELYPVKYADAVELSKELTQVVTAVFTSAGKGRAVLRIIPVTQINALMIISGEPGLARNLLAWIAKLDQPATESQAQIFVYPLAHANAEEISGVLNQVFKTDAKKAAKTAAATPSRPADAVSRRTRQAPGAAAAPVVGNVQITAGGDESPVTIVADKATNSLIIQTAVWYYPVVEETIRKLDKMPKQVLIEVLIAEISLDDDNRFGLQWMVRGQGNAEVFGESHAFNSEVQNVFPPLDAAGIVNPQRGFSFLIAEANRVTAVLNAYAREQRLNIISAPHIMATDNQEATIEVGDEVPIITTQTTETAGGTGGLAGNTVTNDVEYRNTGVLLTVTPHINEDRYVTLDVRQEVSIAEENDLGGTTSPIINKRTAETTMVVKDNETLVIGGLMDEQKEWSREGLPYLSKIPVLGYLFGTTVEVTQKKELLLLITPRVVANPSEGNAVSKMLRDRALTLKEGIELFTDLPREEE